MTQIDPSSNPTTQPTATQPEENKPVEAKPTTAKLADHTSVYDLKSEPRRSGGRQAIQLLVADNADGSSSTNEDTPTDNYSKGDATRPSRPANVRAPSPSPPPSSSSSPSPTSYISVSEPRNSPQLEPTTGAKSVSEPHVTPNLPVGEYSHSGDGQIIVVVTSDGENYVRVDLTGHTDAQDIRERMLYKLHISANLQSISIYRTELEGVPIGGALDDKQLVIYCQNFGDNRGTLKFFIQRTDAPSEFQSHRSVSASGATTILPHISTGSHPTHSWGLSDSESESDTTHERETVLAAGEHRRKEVKGKERQITRQGNTLSSKGQQRARDQTSLTSLAYRNSARRQSRIGMGSTTGLYMYSGTGLDLGYGGLPRGTFAALTEDNEGSDKDSGTSSRVPSRALKAARDAFASDSDESVVDTPSGASVSPWANETLPIADPVASSTGGLGIKRSKKHISSRTAAERKNMSKSNSVTKIRKPPASNSATLQHVVSPVPNSRGIVHPSNMSIHEMFEYLIYIGCPDLTQFVDPNEYSRNFIAAGGFGDIFKGKLNDATPVAIKVWRSRALNEELGKAGKRAMREIYNWSQLDHENIQKLLGVVMFDERLGMVSKWMERGNLQDYLQKNPRVDGYPLCVQIAQGVKYLHSQNMIHGDLKAINILVSSDHKLKLTDFDYSIMAESTVFSQTTRLGGGTLRWMAPELVLDLTGDQQRNKQTDIYALGMTFLVSILSIFGGLYSDETLSRIIPYFPQCKNDGSVLNAISQKRIPERNSSFFGSDQRGNRMWELLTRCWDHDPAARPIAAEVTVLLQTLIRETEPGNTVEPPRSRRGRSAANSHLSHSRDFDKQWKIGL